MVVQHRYRLSSATNNSRQLWPQHAPVAFSFRWSSPHTCQRGGGRGTRNTALCVGGHRGVYNYWFKLSCILFIQVDQSAIALAHMVIRSLSLAWSPPGLKSRSTGQARKTDRQDSAGKTAGIRSTSLSVGLATSCGMPLIHSWTAEEGQTRLCGLSAACLPHVGAPWRISVRRRCERDQYARTDVGPSPAQPLEASGRLGAGERGWAKGGGLSTWPMVNCHGACALCSAPCRPTGTAGAQG